MMYPEVEVKYKRLGELAEEVERRNEQVKALQDKPAHVRSRQENDELVSLQMTLAGLNDEWRALQKELKVGEFSNPIKPDPQDGNGSYRTTDAGEIRLYKPGESVASAFRSALPDGIRAEDLSVGRAIAGIVTGNWRGREAEKRAMSSGADGYILDPMAGRFIDLARNNSVLMQAGAVTLPMQTQEVTLTKQLTDPTAYWRGENVEVTESQPTFGAVRMRAKTAAARIVAPVEVIEDSTNGPQLIESSLAAKMGLELDRVGWFGIGAEEEPLGLYNTPGLSEVDLGTNGAVLPDYDDFMDALQLLYEANGTPTAAVYSPRTLIALSKLTDGNDLPLPRPPLVADLRHLVSNQISNELTHGSAENASVAFLGGFENVLIGMRSSIRIEASREAGTAFSHLQVWIRAYMRVDIAVMRPEQICKITGIIPTGG